MRKSQVFGTIDWIDISYISAIAVTNIINQIVHNKDFIERALYTAPLLLSVFLIHCIPFKKYIKSFIFLSLAIIVHLDMPDPDGFGSAIFFLFAFAEIQSIRSAVVVCIATLATVLYKGSISGQSVPQAVNMVILSSFIYHRSYFKFFSGSINKPIKTRISELTPEQRKIMTMAGKQGMPQKEIAHETGLSDDKVYSIIHEVRVLFGKDGKPAPLTKVIHELALPIEKSSRKTVSENSQEVIKDKKRKSVV